MGTRKNNHSSSRLEYCNPSNWILQKSVKELNSTEFLDIKIADRQEIGAITTVTNLYALTKLEIIEQAHEGSSTFIDRF